MSPERFFGVCMMIGEALIEFLGIYTAGLANIGFSSPIKPLSVDVRPATEMMHSETSSRVVDLKPTEVYNLFQ